MKKSIVSLLFAFALNGIASAQDAPSGLLDCATTFFSQPGVRLMHRLRAADPQAQVIVNSRLPKGLSWNPSRQRVEGTVEKEGVYTYTAEVRKDGKSTYVPLTLTVSSKLQQPVPFMGWLSWNVFEYEIDDAKVRQVADAFERYGLKDAGYTYLCIDDQWHAKTRDPQTGAPQYDEKKFPKGFNDLADYVHGKGLKFGIYSDAAEQTCAGEYGSLGYEDIDARTYAKWGFDLLKYDYCGAPAERDTAEVRYKRMGDALKATGRDFLYYMCEWGLRDPWKWGERTGASTWRCTYDSRDKWDWGKYDGSHCGALQAINIMKDLWPYGGVNRFNDADMLCVGLHGKGKSSSHNGAAGMTQQEYQSQFSMWCMFASPLTLSFDVRDISPEDLAIITNKEMIAVNQDRMGLHAELIGSNKSYDIYLKDLENGDCALALLNRSEQPLTIKLPLRMIYLQDNKKYIFRDLWSKSETTVKKTLEVSVEPHETKVYRIRKQ